METVAKYRITPGGTVISKGFEGDLLVGMAPTMSNETRTFLSHYADHHNVAVYEVSLTCCCPRRGKLCRVVDFFQTIDSHSGAYRI